MEPEAHNKHCQWHYGPRRCLLWPVLHIRHILLIYLHISIYLHDKENCSKEYCMHTNYPPMIRPQSRRPNVKKLNRTKKNPSQLWGLENIICSKMKIWLVASKRYKFYCDMRRTDWKCISFSANKNGDKMEVQFVARWKYNSWQDFWQSVRG